MGLIYLDSCILIYLTEDGGHLGQSARARVRAEPDARRMISDLGRMEALVGPLRQGDRDLHDRYTRAFERFENAAITREAYERAAELRARHRIATPDALHLATAQLAGCTEFWTNDHRLAAAATDIEIVVVG